MRAETCAHENSIPYLLAGQSMGDKIPLIYGIYWYKIHSAGIVALKEEFYEICKVCAQNIKRI
jgi:hypothetical protein